MHTKRHKAFLERSNIQTPNFYYEWIKKGPKNFGKDPLNPKQKRRKGLPSSRACVVTTFKVRGGALSRVAAPLCLGCRAIGNEEEEEEKKREEEAARSSNRGARVSVCVDGRGHHIRRRPTHKTFPILYKTNDKRKLSSRLSFAFCCVSRPTTEAKHHHHHHHGWRRRAREAHEGTTTI